MFLYFPTILIIVFDFLGTYKKSARKSTKMWETKENTTISLYFLTFALDVLIFPYDFHKNNLCQVLLGKYKKLHEYIRKAWESRGTYKDLIVLSYIRLKFSYIFLQPFLGPKFEIVDISSGPST